MSFRRIALSLALPATLLPLTAAAADEGYRDDIQRRVAAGEAMAFPVPNPDGTRMQSMEVGVEQRNPDWTLRAGDVEVNLRRDDFYPNGVDLRQRLTVTVAQPGRSPSVSHFTDGYEPGLSNEYLRILFSPTLMAVEVACPTRTLIAEIPGKYRPVDSITFSSQRQATILLVEASATATSVIDVAPLVPATTWRSLDSDLDTSLALSGGNYRLGLTAPDANGDMEVIYLGGARTNPDIWPEGARKGRLKATRFDGHFDLVWLDANAYSPDPSAFATLEDGILTLRFPALKATLRFSRE